jgi:hypothetical protein
MIEDVDVGHAAPTIPSGSSRAVPLRLAARRYPAAMSRNGRHTPPRPRIEVRQATASPEEAAAITAAIEQFLRDTAPAPEPTPAPVSRWLRAALREQVGLDPHGPNRWSV